MNYIEQIKKTHANFDFRNNLLYYLIGLSGEVGELQELFKKIMFREPLRDYYDDESQHKIKLEMGDVYCYLILLIDEMGFNLDEIQELNLQKLKSRGLL